jgi:hypothetical protein
MEEGIKKIKFSENFNNCQRKYFSLRLMQILSHGALTSFHQIVTNNQEQIFQNKPIFKIFCTFSCFIHCMCEQFAFSVNSI